MIQNEILKKEKTKLTQGIKIKNLGSSRKHNFFYILKGNSLLLKIRKKAYFFPQAA